MQKQVLSSEVRHGMSYNREIWTLEGNDPVELGAVYNAKGIYVGDPGTADFLASKGIQPEPRTEHSNVCSIGFSPKEQKWFGWSHRAICGFGIGSKVSDGDCATDGLPIGYEATTLDHAKEIAKAFAAAVS